MPRARNSGKRTIRPKKQDDGIRTFIKSTLSTEDVEFIKGYKFGFWKGLFIGFLVGILIMLIVTAGGSQ